MLTACWQCPPGCPTHRQVEAVLLGPAPAAGRRWLRCWHPTPRNSFLLLSGAVPMPGDAPEQVDVLFLAPCMLQIMPNLKRLLVLQEAVLELGQAAPQTSLQGHQPWWVPCPCSSCCSTPTTLTPALLQLPHSPPATPSSASSSSLLNETFTQGFSCCPGDLRPREPLGWTLLGTRTKKAQHVLRPLLVSVV